MAIHNGDFARTCVNQGLFFGVNPHFLLAVAFVASGIKNDTVGDAIGPYRLKQTDWNAKLADPLFEGSLTSADISEPVMQCLFGAVQTLHAQNELIKSLERNPSADELYGKWPVTPALPGNSLQTALDSTRALVAPAVDAALAGMDEHAFTGIINLNSIAAGQKTDNAKLIIDRFAGAGYEPVHQVTALANAIAESSLNANSVYETSSEHSVGLFQLNMKGGLGSGHSEINLKDPHINIRLIINAANKVPEFKAADDLQTAMSIFVRKIERPANQPGEIIKRLAIARTLFA